MTRRKTEATKPKIVIEAKTPYEYTTTFPLGSAVGRRSVVFSETEIKHLLVSTAIVVAVGVSMIANPLGSSLYEFLGFIGTGFASMLFALIFLVHEIAHKVAAQRSGLWAEFRLIPMGALLTVISIFSPFFKIISPGAVMIGSGYTDRKTIGKVAFAGPLTNLILAPIFLVVAIFVFAINPVIYLIAVYGLLFNGMIALLNLIPFGILDGYKIFQWSKTVWAVAFVSSIALVAVTYILFF